MHPVLLYKEIEGSVRASVSFGTISADEKGRLVFRDNDNSFTLLFIDAKDKGAIADALAKSNIKITLPPDDQTLF